MAPHGRHISRCLSIYEALSTSSGVIPASTEKEVDYTCPHAFPRDNILAPQAAAASQRPYLDGVSLDEFSVGVRGNGIWSKPGRV
eukprot:364269-Chlamydomonas_euryale.AAC.6